MSELKPCPTPIEELVPTLRAGPVRDGEGPEGIVLFDIEGTHETMFEAADALEAQSAEIVELEKAAKLANDGFHEECMTNVSIREAAVALRLDNIAKDAETARLRKVIGEIAARPSDIPIPHFFVATARAALAREPEEQEGQEGQAGG